MNKTNECLILISNDDGVSAPGIKALINIATKFGKVVVVAPDKPQSGMGHAITIDSTLQISQIKKEKNLEIYSTTGTPVDCMKLAINEILKDNKPNLILSGINHGSNASINVIYSGTMSAAIEGSLEKIPAIGFSLENHSINANFEPYSYYIELIISNVLKKGIKPGTCLNVNIPFISEEDIKGTKVCRQANATWIEKFEKRLNPKGEYYYWLTGELIENEETNDTDLYYLKNNYITIVPVKADLTDHGYIKKLSEFNFNEHK